MIRKKSNIQTQMKIQIILRVSGLRGKFNVLTSRLIDTCARMRTQELRLQRDRKLVR
jgi:hypothetical protein